jgi:hypothetical protein
MTLNEAMRAGRIKTEELGPEFENGGAWVEFELRAELPGGIPADIKASWIIPEMVDDFRITVLGTAARAELDLRKSREGVFLYGEGGPRFFQGPPAVSSYEWFITAAEGYAAGDSAWRDAPYTELFGFERGLLVQRTLDMLVPGGLPR